MSETANTQPIAHEAEIQISIRPTDAGDIPFLRNTWRESYKLAPECARLSWATYKQTAGRDIDTLLAREDTKTLGAYDASGRLYGWVAWTPGRALSHLHYVYTRHELNDVKLRRRGVATALLEEAKLGSRVVYTHHGGKRQHSPERLDEMLVAWANKRGVHATFVRAGEFLR